MPKKPRRVKEFLDITSYSHSCPSTRAPAGLLISDGFHPPVALVKSANGVETPVYDVSRTLRDAKMRYPRVEKLVYTLASQAEN